MSEKMLKFYEKMLLGNFRLDCFVKDAAIASYSHWHLRAVIKSHGEQSKVNRRHPQPRAAIGSHFQPRSVIKSEGQQSAVKGSYWQKRSAIKSNT
jgi:hypothetical protein